MVPSDRIAWSKGSTRLGASLPEDGNGASKTSCLFKKLDDFQKIRWCPLTLVMLYYVICLHMTVLAMQALVCLHMVQFRVIRFGAVQSGSTLHTRI
jgi:hypothetical protein